MTTKTSATTISKDVESLKALKATEYSAWMAKAFLMVESALAHELATPSRICMSEDHLRISLIRGLTYTHPERAHRVKSEFSAKWATGKCWNRSHHDFKWTGRPLQHDVAIEPVEKDGGTHEDKGLICEVKWLKQAQSGNVAKDIWKLALSRGSDAEGKALRTYILIGGDGLALSQTFRRLRNYGIDIRWSNAGRRPGTPPPRNIDLTALLSHDKGKKALTSLLKAGKHYHHPPDKVWQTLRLSIRAKWHRTIDKTHWRAILFELDHWGVNSDAKIDWTKVKPEKFKC